MIDEFLYRLLLAWIKRCRYKGMGTLLPQPFQDMVCVSAARGLPSRLISIYFPIYTRHPPLLRPHHVSGSFLNP